MAPGTVKWYSTEKRYGFIQPDDKNNNDVFVHMSSVAKAGLSILSEGQKVSYDVEEKNGKASAVNLELLS
jgi:CspA family cold shock protein